MRVSKESIEFEKISVHGNLIGYCLALPGSNFILDLINIFVRLSVLFGLLLGFTGFSMNSNAFILIWIT